MYHLLTKIVLVLKGILDTLKMNFTQIFLNIKIIVKRISHDGLTFNRVNFYYLSILQFKSKFDVFFEICSIEIYKVNFN